jgi:hypothetical protein
LHSSHLAAGSILRNLNNGIFDFKGYDSAVKNEIVGELNFSRRLLSFFIAFPRLTHEVIKYNERVWEAFCKVLRGEESYGAFGQTTFGLSGFIWHPVSKLASLYERRRFLENRSEETTFFRVLRKLFIPLLKRI